MNLRRHISILRAFAYPIIGAVIVAAGLAFAILTVLPRTYESRATLYVGQSLGQPQLDYSGLLASQILTQTYAQLATTRPILSAVIDKLKLSSSPEALQNQVTVDVPPQGTLFAIVVRNQDAGSAAAIANGIAQQMLAQAPKEDPAADAGRQRRLADLDATIARLQKEINALRAVQQPTAAQNDRLDSLQERLVSFSDARASLASEGAQASPNALNLVDPAVPSASPVGPSRLVAAGAAGAGAFVVFALLAYVVDAVRPQHRTMTAAKPASVAKSTGAGDMLRTVLKDPQSPVAQPTAVEGVAPQPSIAEGRPRSAPPIRGQAPE